MIWLKGVFWWGVETCICLVKAFNKFCFKLHKGINWKMKKFVLLNKHSSYLNYTIPQAKCLHNIMSQVKQVFYGCSQQLTFCAPCVHIRCLFNMFYHVHIRKDSLVIKINSHMNLYIFILHITTKSEILINKSTLIDTSSGLDLNI